MKQTIAEHIVPDPRRLPYREEILEHLRELRLAGVSLVLATATTAKVANRVSGHLGIFDAVLASDETRNLKGPAKLAAIHAYCAKHGHDSYSYLGDSMADLPVWKEAAQVYVVAPSAGLRTAVKRLRRPTKVFAERHGPGESLAQSVAPLAMDQEPVAVWAVAVGTRMG